MSLRNVVAGSLATLLLSGCDGKEEEEKERIGRVVVDEIEEISKEVTKRFTFLENDSPLEEKARDLMEYTAEIGVEVKDGLPVFANDVRSSKVTLDNGMILVARQYEGRANKDDRSIVWHEARGYSFLSVDTGRMRFQFFNLDGYDKTRQVEAYVRGPASVVNRDIHSLVEAALESAYQSIVHPKSGCVDR
ncbi:hypothetical protein J4210_05690 [Candidatus Woesearchaeota archaeon]|nr:hypothetical protein [Candidatus Woesearchaeota archaeon]